MLQGVTIKLSTRTQTGTDAFNRPVETIAWKDVENVLYAPVSSSDVVTTVDLSGYSEVYQLAIPKGDTNTWTGEQVQFLGKTWDVVGTPIEGIEALIPLAWNRKVTVARHG